MLLFAFGLLLVSFRSIVIALKAIVLNLLSVAAAYGVLVAIFQWGWGENLLDFQSNGGIANWLPMFMFVILFGLSMDYHVFILSRIREAYDRGLSTDDAISHGIKSTAGVVTSAAVVMVGVFLVFTMLPLVDLKEMGIGLAVAVLIDATLVRAVLLPATMKLLGERQLVPAAAGSSGCRGSSTSARSSRSSRRGQGRARAGCLTVAPDDPRARRLPTLVAAGGAPRIPLGGSMDTVTPHLDTGLAARVVAWLHSDVRMARLAIGAVALHVVDDNFLQPNAGHLGRRPPRQRPRPLALLVAARRLLRPAPRRAHARSIALLAGVLGVLVGIEAVHYTRAVGPVGRRLHRAAVDRSPGSCSIGLGARDAVAIAPPRRPALVALRPARAARLRRCASSRASSCSRSRSPTSSRTPSRATVPAADLGAPYEDVEFTTERRARLKGWYIRSRNGAAVISFPGRASSQKRAKLLARHGYGVLLFDRRGEGESEGDPNLFGWEGERDVHAAVAFLQGRARRRSRADRRHRPLGRRRDDDRGGGGVDGPEGDRVRGRERPLRPRHRREPGHDLAGGHRQRRRDRGNGGLLEQRRRRPT